MKPSVLINLDRPRNIRFDTNALVKAEEVLKKPLPMIGTNFGFRETRALLWAGLLHEDKYLTLDEVGDLMDICGPAVATEKVYEAANLAFNKSEEEEGKN